MNPCRATVKESGGSFTISQISHKHDPETGTAVACKVVKKIKEIVVTDVFKPASAIVENVLLETLETDRPCSALPKVNFMARNANRYRRRLRPEEPRDLDFELLLTRWIPSWRRSCLRPSSPYSRDKRTTEVIGENKALVCIIIALRLNIDE